MSEEKKYTPLLYWLASGELCLICGEKHDGLAVRSECVDALKQSSRKAYVYGWEVAFAIAEELMSGMELTQEVMTLRDALKKFGDEPDMDLFDDWLSLNTERRDELPF